MMKKLFERMTTTRDDNESLILIGKALKDYPTEKNYRVEFYVQPCFVRIVVYKMEYGVK